MTPTRVANAKGTTMFPVRYMVVTSAGWLGAYDVEAFDAFVAQEVAAEREAWKCALRTLRDAVIAQNRDGTAWHPHTFAPMMDGLSQAAALLDVPNDQVKPARRAGSA